VKTNHNSILNTSIKSNEFRAGYNFEISKMI